jgi:hemoglobin
MTEQAAPSIYDQIGGAPAVEAAVNLFYSKVVADERVADFFKDINMPRQIAKQRAFFTFALGGPNDYTGKNMREGHAHLVARGLNDSHFNAIVELVGATLGELGVPENLRSQISQLLESTRADVLGR